MDRTTDEADIEKRLQELTDMDWQKIADVTAAIRQHTGSWGAAEGGVMHDGVFTMPYTVPDPLISRFLDLLYSLRLVINFDWPHWDAGREIYRRSGPDKFAGVSATDILKLLTAVIRNDRFSDGALVAFFESGDALTLLERLLDNRPADEKR